jgi:hypothetical protein|nr:MAG TPA: hypothetical protein [Caudoviricetes sp.]
MSYDVTKLTKLGSLKELAQRINTDFAKKTELTPIKNSADAAFKSGKVEGNKVQIFTTPDKTGAAAFEFDFPVEMVLDQAKTAFVPKFAWSAETYPGSTDPKLEGKPVMVLAVKGSDGSVNYSFMGMAALVDTYKAKVEGKDASTTVTISGYEVDVKVNISQDEGNALEARADGLYVPKPSAVDLSGKADKVKSAVAGNFAGLDAGGNLTDSGKKAADFVAAEAGKRLMTNAEGTKLEGIAANATKVEASATPGSIKINGAETRVVTIASDTEVTEMLNEVFGPTV